MSITYFKILCFPCFWTTFGPLTQKLELLPAYHHLVDHQIKMIEINLNANFIAKLETDIHFFPFFQFVCFVLVVGGC